MAIKKATIVLEGGATRGIFTSGVLDYRQERAMHWIMYPGSRGGQETV